MSGHDKCEGMEDMFTDDPRALLDRFLPPTPLNQLREQWKANESEWREAFEHGLKPDALREDTVTDAGSSKTPHQLAWQLAKELPCGVLVPPNDDPNAFGSTGLHEAVYGRSTARLSAMENPFVVTPITSTEQAVDWMTRQLDQWREALERGPSPTVHALCASASIAERAPASSASSAVPDPFGLVAALTETFPAARVIASADGTYANAQLEGKSVSLNKTGSIVVASVYSEALVEAQSGENAAVALRLLLSDRSEE